MALLRPEHLDADELTYRIFGLGRDNSPWRTADVLASGPFTEDQDRAELAWRLASRGYYAEQAGLVAAASLAAVTDDTALRFSLATATADEARHADAFYRYARTVGGEPDECLEELEPLDAGLTALPYLGKMLVHTMLEGFAADEFLILAEVFADDPLGQLYRHIRRDEIRHVAIGLNYLARTSATRAGRQAWQESGPEWTGAGLAMTNLAAAAAWLADLTGRDADTVHEWFLRRHRARLMAAGIEPRKGGDRR
jgi:rubrerythrin